MARAMKDSGIEWIGKIPNNWSITPFRAYVKERTERNKYKKTTELLSLSFALGVTLFKDKIYNKDRIKENFEEYNIVYENDLVLSPNDIIKGSIFVSKYYGCISPMYFVFSPRCENTHNLYYLSYLLRTREAGRRFFFIARGLIGAILDNGKYVTRRMSVSRNDLLSFKVLLPSYREQTNIVSFLDSKCQEIDNVLAKTRSSIEEYKKLKQAIITKAVTEGIRKNRKMKDSGIEWIGEIPEEWSVYKIKYVTMFNPSVNTKGLEADSIVTFTPMECIYNGYFEPKETTLKMMSSSYTPYEEGDIVIAKVTPCFENGNIAIMENLKSGVGFGSSELFVLRPTVCNTKFLFYWLQNTIFKQNGCSTMTGTGGLKRVSPYFVKNSFVLCPDIEEQCVITKYLDSKCSAIDILISKKEQLISELETYKKSLIYEYVTGKKEVPMV